ncbi:hypothetical protein BZZ01_05005 [Nostocales cyanobacterium HT-58-2]|nr:hypothetical protein BZZ01_05005 [Nostocales cyanobacterium HT-58-2]
MTPLMLVSEPPPVVPDLRVIPTEDAQVKCKPVRNFVVLLGAIIALSPAAIKAIGAVFIGGSAKATTRAVSVRPKGVQGQVGDRINSFLAGCGFNLRKLYRFFVTASLNNLVT